MFDFKIGRRSSVGEETLANVNRNGSARIEHE